MKKLYLVRHAKSSWKDSSLHDQERPLNGRGMKDAPEMGKRLASAGIKIDQIVSSPAKRALDTARFIANEIAYPHDRIRTNDGIYFNGARGMLQIIQATSSDIATLMLVGHNPDMTELLNDLCGYQVDNMPTCAIACIAVGDEWSQLDYDGGELMNYNIPRDSGQF